MPPELELCPECMGMMQAGSRREHEPGPGTNQIQCGSCGKRRFGATYVATKIIRRRKKEETA